MPKQNYYEFFGLKNFEDDQKVIKSAYRSMALKWHPDRNEDKVTAEHMMKQVNEVYRVLSTSKKSYDDHIGRKSRGNGSEFKYKGFDFSDTDWADILKKHQARTDAEFVWAKSDKDYKAGDAFTWTADTAEPERDHQQEAKDNKDRTRRKIKACSLEEQRAFINQMMEWTVDEFTTLKMKLNDIRAKRGANY